MVVEVVVAVVVEVEVAVVASVVAIVVLIVIAVGALLAAVAVIWVEMIAAGPQKWNRYDRCSLSVAHADMLRVMSVPDRRASEIEPRNPQWVFDRRAPRGAISLLVGADGSGKSTLITSLTAGWTTGELTGRAEEVHLSLVEDDVAAVTVPRLITAGADLERVHLLERRDAWAFPRDLERFASYLSEHGITIAVLDPLDHHVDDIAGQAGRQTLGQLAGVAEMTGVGLIIVHHFTKAGTSIGIAIGGGRGVKGVARSILIWGRSRWRASCRYARPMPRTATKRPPPHARSSPISSPATDRRSQACFSSGSSIPIRRIKT